MRQVEGCAISYFRDMVCKPELEWLLRLRFLVFLESEAASEFELLAYLHPELEEKLEGARLYACLPSSARQGFVPPEGVRLAHLTAVIGAGDDGYSRARQLQSVILDVEPVVAHRQIVFLLRPAHGAEGSKAMEELPALLNGAPQLCCTLDLAAKPRSVTIEWLEGNTLDGDVPFIHVDQHSSGQRGCSQDAKHMQITWLLMGPIGCRGLEAASGAPTSSKRVHARSEAFQVIAALKKVTKLAGVGELEPATAEERAESWTDALHTLRAHAPEMLVEDRAQLYSALPRLLAPPLVPEGKPLLPPEGEQRELYQESLRLMREVPVDLATQAVHLLDALGALHAHCAAAGDNALRQEADSAIQGRFARAHLGNRGMRAALCAHDCLAGVSLEGLLPALRPGSLVGAVRRIVETVCDTLSEPLQTLKELKHNPTRSEAEKEAALEEVGYQLWGAVASLQPCIKNAQQVVVAAAEIASDAQHPQLEGLVPDALLTYACLEDILKGLVNPKRLVLEVIALKAQELMACLVSVQEALKRGIPLPDAAVDEMRRSDAGVAMRAPQLMLAGEPAELWLRDKVVALLLGSAAFRAAGQAGRKLATMVKGMDKPDSIDVLAFSLAADPDEAAVADFGATVVSSECLHDMQEKLHGQDVQGPVSRIAAKIVTLETGEELVAVLITADGSELLALRKALLDARAFYITSFMEAVGVTLQSQDLEVMAEAVASSVGQDAMLPALDALNHSVVNSGLLPNQSVLVGAELAQTCGKLSSALALARAEVGRADTVTWLVTRELTTVLARMAHGGLIPEQEPELALVEADVQEAEAAPYTLTAAAASPAPQMGGQAGGAVLSVHDALDALGREGLPLIDQLAQARIVVQGAKRGEPGAAAHIVSMAGLNPQAMPFTPATRRHGA
eukprot:scaffold16.g76.t1